MIPEVRVRVHDEQLRKAFAQAPNHMRKAATIAIEMAMGELVRDIVPRVPVAHGFLAQAIDSELRGESVEGVIRGEVFVNPPADRYALPVETGRKPGKRPPLDAILLWLDAPKMKAVVLSLAQEIAEKRTRRRERRVFRGVDAEELAETPFALEPAPAYKRTPEEQAKRDLAFLIQRKIGKEGTEGAWMFTDAFAENEERITALIRGQIEDAAATALNRPDLVS